MATYAAASPMGGVSGGDDAMTAIQKYGTFVEEVLKPQLQASLAQRDALSAEIREYEELQTFIREQLDTTRDATTPLTTLMDLGQRFHVRAKIVDTRMITVDIGLNFHAEMTMHEADVFVHKHLEHLNDKRRRWQDKAREISAHVNVVLDAIQKLAALQSQTPMMR